MLEDTGVFAWVLGLSVIVIVAGAFQLWMGLSPGMVICDGLLFILIVMYALANQPVSRDEEEE
jgi:hypothetical protein